MPGRHPGAGSYGSAQSVGSDQSGSPASYGDVTYGRPTASGSRAVLQAPKLACSSRRPKLTNRAQIRAAKVANDRIRARSRPEAGLTSKSAIHPPEKSQVHGAIRRPCAHCRHELPAGKRTRVAQPHSGCCRPLADVEAVPTLCLVLAECRTTALEQAGRKSRPLPFDR
jgi:hypothetical protein